MSLWSTLRNQLESLRQKLLAAESTAEQRISSASGSACASARNLVHYLALRHSDVRRLQLELAQHGLSSLGRSEGYVMANLEAVLDRVRDAEGVSTATACSVKSIDWSEAEAVLHANTRAIFGPKPPNRHVYIMVTAPGPDIADDTWFDRQIAAGTNLLRINGAHGTREDWDLLAQRARAAVMRHGTALRLLVDLPGPKVRTTSTIEGPRVLKLKPLKDELGRIVRPARVVFGPTGIVAKDATVLPVPEPALLSLQPGDTLNFRDARGKQRSIVVTERRAEGHATGEIAKTAFITSDTILTARDPNGVERTTFTCPDIPARPFVVSVPIGGLMILCAEGVAEATTHATAPVFGCTLSEVFGAVRIGQRLMIDDGKIETEVVHTERDTITLKVVRAQRGVAKIRGDMGLNLPDTCLSTPAISERDTEALSFLEAEGDLVGLSFVRSLADVRLLEQHLKRQDIGLLLKIETRTGFEALPSLLLDTLGRRPLAVMIARGDLAVECGFERLAEIQEEILWLCEASHVPVIWATQVLETLAKTGFPTRAEVTDAAMSVRAECVMLNKGPFIESATKVLDSILQRMEMHTYKKRQLYPPLAMSLTELDPTLHSTVCKNCFPTQFKDESN